jgi:hypothetical protein
MFKYPMSNRDAMRSVMVRVPAAGVVFTDAGLNLFYQDSLNGLCTVEFNRAPPIVSNLDHYVIVDYSDPELEFERRLSV